MQALVGGIALIVGILLGFWLKLVSGKAEKAQLERRSEELTAELAGVRAELTKAQAESGARAGFESLAVEREKTIAQLAAERDGLRADLQAKGAVESALNARVKELETELRNERQNLAEKLALLESAKQALANQFEALAGEILEKKSKSFAEGSQKELGTLLTPLKEQIKEFREKVEKAQSESNTGVTKLETLIGTLGGLNLQLAEEARNLTTALRGSSKAQGDWGELIVRNLLEKAGLREGEQFRVQETFDAAGDYDERQRKVRPDVIVNLPGGRHLVIDSKVSLNAYTDSVNAATDEERKAAVKRHLASVRGHVDELASRRYHKLGALETPDFVVMFVPIEPAFLTALHEDEGLWRYGYEKEVLLVGPTTLLFVIRIVDNLWQQELQARSVQDVMNRGAELYDKFVGFVSDLEAVGKSLRGADESYGKAMKKLSEGRGNLIRQVELLKGLGVRTGKALPRSLLDAAGADETNLVLESGAEEVE
ncbi:MAG: DNA recombination protein RmuC [Terracidiphilus sp.]|jgi:DNA recombination protein RmuC